ncbi:MAG: SDR family oxidoreductase [Lentisphaerae bacterium]|nr:SDR family oxidoreductase [Lentisphaerota bacterium]MBT4822204.1 SDR family oxidoreductase [Lentisphaerota bacterium]MBT5612766.1 SDR family oxidoreductase [Lentisphaerota bacterium]MBT7058995.1 SDR family oxidoreductase [Lentisphaerota bacterium]MBT7848415.1 SDR family oxidoreductase [Lentisphaerota bacterium]
MSFLGLQDKTIVVVGVANRRSVAYAISRVLTEAGAKVVYVVRDSEVLEGTRKLLGPAPVVTCDVECQDQVDALPSALVAHCETIDGLVHSIAFANYSDGFGAFHKTQKADFLQAVDVSCFSLVNVTNALRPMMNADASVVTISISTTRMAAENYGYMAPIKAALDSSVVFLAKSLSAESCIRVNAVGAGLLKTSASAGIPGYVDSYLYAEEVMPRKRALQTDEVANVAAFLLSPRSSGINAQTVVVDGAMSINYFDRTVVRRVVEGR